MGIAEWMRILDTVGGLAQMTGKLRTRTADTGIVPSAGGEAGGIEARLAYRELGGTDAKMDFKPIFENAEKAGMKKYIVEVEEFNSTPIEGVKKSLEFLQNAEYVK